MAPKILWISELDVEGRQELFQQEKIEEEILQENKTVSKYTF